MIRFAAGSLALLAITQAVRRPRENETNARHSNKRVHVGKKMFSYDFMNV